MWYVESGLIYLAGVIAGILVGRLTSHLFKKEEQRFSAAAIERIKKLKDKAGDAWY
jgi:hypothetical protein